MNHVQLDIRGHDDLAGFTGRIGVCGVCGVRGLTVKYARDVPEQQPLHRAYKDLPWETILSATILGKSYQQAKRHTRGNLGITCGCYAKFHRQLAHVNDKWKGEARDKLKEKPAA